MRACAAILSAALLLTGCATEPASMTVDEARTYVQKPPPECMSALKERAREAQARGEKVDAAKIDPRCWKEYSGLAVRQAFVQEQLEEYDAEQSAATVGPPAPATDAGKPPGKGPWEVPPKVGMPIYIGMMSFMLYEAIRAMTSGGYGNQPGPVPDSCPTIPCQ